MFGKQILVAAIAAGASLLAHADEAYVTSRSLSANTANTLALASLEACKQQGYQVAVAVVDRTGSLLAFNRDPLAGHHTIDVATRKAYTSASFQSTTIDLQARGMQALGHAENVLIVGGGVPIRVGGHFYGAVGVSGAPAKKITGDVDEECAQKGIAAITEILEFAQ
ncbi:MAG: heme-binding protein [Gammaproteobacteria bacterium]|nr:heme-binding protein [Gammaproteobacteria bacterium]